MLNLRKIARIAGSRYTRTGAGMRSLENHTNTMKYCLAFLGAAVLATFTSGCIVTDDDDDDDITTTRTTRTTTVGAPLAPAAATSTTTTVVRDHD
jgi:hypothetical protein